ncbi:hypothetical protein BLOT_002901 [Blomia tropicalis]|nr:hypothetical protein BLOT_002901 [Blomia tropicalis]
MGFLVTSYSSSCCVSGQFPFLSSSSSNVDKHLYLRPSLSSKGCDSIVVSRSTKKIHAKTRKCELKF